jgi:Holliday junction resolvase RusA-like endonuclease
MTESLFEPADAVYDPRWDLAFDVLGVPGPQGSKLSAYNPKTGRTFMKESSAKVATWREAVVSQCRDGLPGDEFEPILGAVRLTIVFRFQRPKSHYRTGQLAHLLRDNAPTFHTTYPDVDKCVRATMDALKIVGVYRDDKQVCDLGQTRKLYCTPGERPGALIIVGPL